MLHTFDASLLEVTAFNASYAPPPHAGHYQFVATTTRYGTNPQTACGLDSGALVRGTGGPAELGLGGLKGGGMVETPVLVEYSSFDILCIWKYLTVNPKNDHGCIMCIPIEQLAEGGCTRIREWLFVTQPCYNGVAKSIQHALKPFRVLFISGYLQQCLQRTSSIGTIRVVLSRFFCISCSFLSTCFILFYLACFLVFLLRLLF